MTKKTQARDPQTARDEMGAEADAWLARFNSGMLSGDQARAFNAWLAADPEHERVFRAGQEAMRNVSLMRGEPDLAEMMRPSLYERFHEAFYELRRNRSLRMGLFGAVSLLTAVAGGAAALFVYFQPGAQSGAYAPQIVEAPPAYETQVAEIRDVVLPDGSTITLGAASSVDVRFSGTERRVVLSSGEAFFDVTKDPDRPFVVAAGNTLVRVLGTKFDINLGDEAVDIAVLEGRVEVIRPLTPSRKIRDEDVKHVLIAGQKVAAPRIGRVEPVLAIEAENVAAWRRGELIWVDQPVRNILEDLNRYSPSRIELADPSLAHQEYTLAIRADDIPGGLDTLAAALGVEVETRADGSRVLR